jgi:hypothetical protein
MSVQHVESNILTARDPSPCPLGVYRVLAAIITRVLPVTPGVDQGSALMGTNNKDEVIEGASSGNAKRQAPESHETFITIY